MNTKKRIATIAAALTIATTSLVSFGISEAMAIDQVTCGTRTDWFKVTPAVSLPLCFANNGSLNITVNNLWTVHSGNNSGYYYANGLKVNFLAGTVDIYGSSKPTLNSITITGR